MTDDKSEKTPPAWEKRDGFKVNGELRKVVEATQQVTTAELAKLRRQLERLTRGGLWLPTGSPSPFRSRGRIF